MQINPSLLLLMLVILVFSPSIQEWATHGGTAWYRPYELWLVVIAFIFWNQRHKQNKEKAENKEKSSNTDES